MLGLEEGIEVIGEADSGEAALEKLGSGLETDVVLMDIRMPGMGGIEATRQLRARHPDLGVVLLTTFEEEEDMVAGLQAGASGYLLKDVSVETLRSTIERVAQGERYIQPRVAQFLADALARKRSSPEVQPERLTPREVEIVSLIAKGLPNKRIAQALSLTEGTVKVHVSNILSKLGAADRLEAARIALDAGLIE
nr:response regulator transcription factor [Deinobacterium chartae]